MPREAYLVEPPSSGPHEPTGDRLLPPFAAGPGSHRDNWLLRRFLALEAWDDAAHEFARVWEIHRRHASPHLVEIPVRQDGGQWVREKRLIQPVGFDGRGLQFALDYAFFLRQTKHDAQVQRVLQESLLQIDLDRNPNHLTLLPVPRGDEAKYPASGQDPSRRTYFGWGFSAGVSRKEFIRLAYGVFKSAGKEADLVAVLEKAMDGGENRLRRVLARIRAHQGQHDAALQLELASSSRRISMSCRLMRLYEREQHLDQLRALGLQIAAGEKPFGAWWTLDPSQHQYREENQLPEDLNACLALLVQHADTATLVKLTALWKDRGDLPAARQLARRLAVERQHADPNPGQASSILFGAIPSAGLGGAEGRDVGWANLPVGVRAIVSHETVLALARDDQHLYAGHPWGVTVYGLDGKPRTRIALAEAAKALAVGAGQLWAGTPKGLFRIEPGTWNVAHVWRHQDVPENDRHARSFSGPADYWFDNGVYSLAADGDELWIGLHRNVQRLNLRTRSLRAYSYGELKLQSWGGFDQILPDGEYVWAGSRDFLRRYEREPLLTTAGILAAVRTIGPESSQLFYRQLAAEKDTEGRHEAAERLADARPEDRSRNLPVLRNLLADEQVSVRIAAAVSLLMLGERDVQTAILGWLDSAAVWEAGETLRQLERVRDGQSLVFARSAIQRLAEHAARRADGDRRAQELLQRIAQQRDRIIHEFDKSNAQIWMETCNGAARGGSEINT